MGIGDTIRRLDDEAGRAQAQAAFGAPVHGARRPSVAGYWIGGAIIAVGVVGAIAWFVVGLVGFARAVDDLQRVAIPGSRVVVLSEGRKAVYYESSGGEKAVVPRLRILIEPLAGGPAVPTGPHSGSVSYSIGGHAGRSAAGFTVARPGRYRVSVNAPAGAPAGAELAIGRGLGGRIVRAIVGGLAILLVGGVAGTVLVVVTSSRRQTPSM